MKVLLEYVIHPGILNGFMVDNYTPREVTLEELKELEY